MTLNLISFSELVVSFSELVVCIYQFSGHCLQKLLKYPLFSPFSIEKPKLQNLTMPSSMSRLLQGHHLNKL